MNHADIACTIEEIIKRETGIVIGEERRIDLDIVLGSRLVFNKMTPEKYIDYVNKNYNEIIILASFFTIQETSFYRYKAHFDRLKLEIIPELILRNAESKTIRILSAGCATGEEPYTIAMITNDLLAENRGWNISITATDINNNALEIAREGIYSKYKLRNIDPWYIDRYFEKPDSARSQNDSRSDYNIIYKLRKKIKEMVAFRQCNLIREPFELAFMNDVDIIFCENVIIYFCEDSIQRLIDNFHTILRDNGYMFLGYSETLNLVRHRFALSWWNDSFAYRKESGTEEWRPDEIASKVGNGDRRNGVHDTPGIDSYPDLINLAIRNFKEGLMPNVAALLKQIETGFTQIDEIFYAIKAEYFFDKKDYIDAANECRKAIGINPQFLDAHMLLAAIYLNLNMLESALFEIRTVLYIDPSSILANYYYAFYNRILENAEECSKYGELAKKLLNENNGNLSSKLYPISPSTTGEIKKRILELS